MYECMYVCMYVYTYVNSGYKYVCMKDINQTNGTINILLTFNWYNFICWSNLIVQSSASLKQEVG
jgi:hypothetical protein